MAQHIILPTAKSKDLHLLEGSTNTVEGKNRLGTCPLTSAHLPIFAFYLTTAECVPSCQLLAQFWGLN